MPRIVRGFVDIPQGTIHYAECGSGDETVLLLHQTPRSWNEFRFVLPLLGERLRAIAMDTVGFGDSTPLEENTIEAWAGAAAAFLDALGVEQVNLVGHHTGAVVAIELAGAEPERVRSVVLSSSPFDSPEKRRAQLESHAIVDDVERKADGSHVLELWRIRAAFYPERNIDLLEWFLIDALKAGPLAAAGHQVVAAYDIQSGVSRLRCPVLLLGATDDPYSYPAIPRLREALPQAQVDEIRGGMVPLPDQLPREFAATVERFLDGL